MQGMHMASVKDQGGQGGGHGIPQASVRPQVRPMQMVEPGVGKVEPMHDQHQRMPDEPKQEHSKRMRRMSEESEFDDDDDDDGHDGKGQKFGGFTSTVCVNFSQEVSRGSSPERKPDRHESALPRGGEHRAQGGGG